MENNHGKNRGTLRDIGQRDHRPEHGSAIISDQLQVYGVRHMMKAGDNQRRVYEAKDRSEYNPEGTGDSCENQRGDGRANSPANRTKDEMCCDNGKNQAAEWNDNH